MNWWILELKNTSGISSPTIQGWLKKVEYTLRSSRNSNQPQSVVSTWQLWMPRTKNTRFCTCTWEINNNVLKFLSVWALVPLFESLFRSIPSCKVYATDCGWFKFAATFFYTPCIVPLSKFRIIITTFFRNWLFSQSMNTKILAKGDKIVGPAVLLENTICWLDFTWSNHNFPIQFSTINWALWSLLICMTLRQLILMFGERQNIKN